ncbi:hypothetical protein CA14_007946 [Aspergillus flavus]|uniref:Uncharacterized protein n=1 Tax=Aspergillus flavus TaxID=5059 RepID=A0AB74BWV3_ASPFL|nr:hypothetical protein NYO67_9558 [Aspergillus flavus]RMZ38426.1 hypothetical protein CA14_007946 [Aspergillus flavus]
MPIPTYSEQDTSNTPSTGTAGQASLETVSSTNSGAGRVLGTGSGGTVAAPGYSSASEDRPLSKEEADRFLAAGVIYRAYLAYWRAMML